MIPQFRAWDDINEKMIYDFYREKIETVDGWYKGELVVRNKNEIHCDLLYSSKKEYIFRHVKELPLMQSTGLKDKNGVEIFDGDILVYDAPKKYAHRRSMHEIAYADGRFFWEFLDLVFCQSNILYRDGYLVIGNIHENPELLEGTE